MTCPSAALCRGSPASFHGDADLGSGGASSRENTATHSGMANCAPHPAAGHVTDLLAKDKQPTSCLHGAKPTVIISLSDEEGMSRRRVKTLAHERNSKENEVTRPHLHVPPHTQHTHQQTRGKTAQPLYRDNHTRAVRPNLLGEERGARGAPGEVPLVQ